MARLRLRRRVLALLLPAAVAAVPAAPAHAAGEPIMPLADVHAGMRCTASSVIRGTEPVPFDAEILDVVSGDAAVAQPRILLRVSGPAVDATGIGPGFSGSPVRCPDAAGTPRIAGAISETIGQYGGKVVLATPIEQVIGQPLTPPRRTTRAVALLRRARPIAGPLSVTGLSPPVARAVERAAGRSGRAISTVPAAPRQVPTLAPPVLKPGSAMAVGLSIGDISAGSVGTVAYVDGDRVWGYGHEEDGAGLRSLFLQDAYVYTVVDNPEGSAELSTYKLAAPGRSLGRIANDTPSAVVGRTGAPPASYPFYVHASDLDAGTTRHAAMRVADERAVGFPTNTSALSTVGPLAVAQMAYAVLAGAPADQGGTMCIRVMVHGRAKPLRTCNRYAGGGGGSGAVGGGPLVQDMTALAQTLEGFRLARLPIDRVSVNLALRRDRRQAYLRSVAAPAVLRRGRTVTLRVRAVRVGGGAVTRSLRLRVPRGAVRGERTLHLEGSAGDLGASPDDALTTVLDIGGEDDAPDDGGPTTLDGLAEQVDDLSRFDGVTAQLSAPGASRDQRTADDGSLRGAIELKADPTLRLSGEAKVRVVVR